MNPPEDMKNIIAMHVDAMIDKIGEEEERKAPNKDARKRERKEYMKKYYQEHKTNILDRSKKRYTPRKNKNEKNEIEKI